MDEGLALVGVRGEHLQPDVVDGLQDPGGGGIPGVEGLKPAGSTVSPRVHCDALI